MVSRVATQKLRLDHMHEVTFNKGILVCVVIDPCHDKRSTFPFNLKKPIITRRGLAG
jgi:hypothetical protein